MKTIPHDKFQEYTNAVLATFTPNKEISPTKDEKISWERVDSVNLYEQDPGTVIFLRGRHPSADYRIRVNESNLDVWKNSDRNGLTASIESIVSWQGSPEAVKVEEGIIKRGSYSMMPYFSYDTTKPKLKSVERPTDIWGDGYLLIYVQKQGKSSQSNRAP